MVTESQANIGSGNGVLPEGTKPFPEPNVDLSSVINNVLWYSYENNFICKKPWPSMNEISFKNISLKLHPNLPGDNELKISFDFESPESSEICHIYAEGYFD